MLTRSYVAAIVMAILCLPATAEVYKWVDDSGKVFYSDRPMDERAAALKIDSRPTDNARITADKQARVERLTLENEEQARTAEDARIDQENRERSAENCRRAQEALASLRNAERLYVPLEDGGRKYLSEDETQARLDRARNDVDEWCDS